MRCIRLRTDSWMPPRIFRSPCLSPVASAIEAFYPDSGALRPSQRRFEHRTPAFDLLTVIQQPRIKIRRD
jgi:hypothetical protein